jgi:arginase
MKSFLSRSIFKTDDNQTWYQPETDQRIGWNDDLSAMLESILSQQLETEESQPTQIFFQLLKQELLYRGFLIPMSYAGRENVHFDSVHLSVSPKCTLFGSSYKTPETVPDAEAWHVIGVPSDDLASKPGSRYGPDLIRERTLASVFRSKSLSGVWSLDGQSFMENALPVYDIGNIKKGLRGSLENLADLVARLPCAGRPLTLGGDHSNTLGVVRGLARRNNLPTAFVQLDYHLDIQTWGEFTENGPLQLESVTHANFVSHLKAEFPSIKIHQVGCRNYQSLNANHKAVAANYLRSVATQISDIQVTMQSNEYLYDRLPIDESLYISIDVDAISSALMPHTGYPAPTGMDLGKIFGILDFLVRRNRIVGIDVMEFADSSDHDKHRTSAEIIVAVLLFILERVGK